MYKFVLRRIAMMVPVILGISFIIFSIVSLTPGDPARIILGEKAKVEDVQKLNEKLGYYDPFIVKYANYMKKAIVGDLGTSYRTGLKVTDELARRFPVTLTLATLVLAITVVVAIPIGVLCAIKKNTLFDGINMILALLLMAMPAFWFGLLLMLLFSLKLDIFPATGSDTLLHFVLPAITAASVNLAMIVKMTRSSMLEVIRQEYVNTARSKGCNERTVILKHALKNALIPVVTALGVNFGYTLGGSILTETVFSMNGLGTLLLLGIRSKDLPVVMGSVMFMACTFSVVTLLVDISYGFIDPRIKAQYQNAKS